MATNAARRRHPRRRHLALVHGQGAPLAQPHHCTTCGCPAREQPGSPLCAACALAARVDLDVLAPVLAQFDEILGPIGGLSGALRDRVALVAAVWLHDHGDPQRGEADLAEALGQGLLNAAIVARGGPA